MAEHHLRVTRTARFQTLGEHSAAVREIWIVCHGYAQLAERFVRHFRPIAHPTRLIVAPEALSRFYLDNSLPHGPDARVGAAWMTREDRDAEIADYVEYLDTLSASLLADRDRNQLRIVAFGFSQGVAAVLRWLALGRTRVDRVVAWSGSVPAELDFAGARHRFGVEPVTYVFGNGDALFDEARIAQQTEALRSARIPYAVVRFTGGHTIDRDTLVQLAGPAPN